MPVGLNSEEILGKCINLLIQRGLAQTRTNEASLFNLLEKRASLFLRNPQFFRLLFGEGSLHCDRCWSQLGIGIETALPAPRSAIQIVSPVGSTPVGVMRPSLSTVTLALSPLTVIAEILPLPFSATRSLPLAARMPSGPFTG